MTEPDSTAVTCDNSQPIYKCACGGAITRFFLSGAPRKRCNDCIDGTHGKPLCVSCGKDLPPGCRKHCSKDCQARHRNPSGKLWSELYKPKPPAFCTHCGIQFKPSRHSRGLFCSYKCRGSNESLICNEVHGIKRLHHLNQIAPAKREESLMRKAARKDKLEQAREVRRLMRAMRPCKQCGKPVGNKHGRIIGQHCSEACHLIQKRQARKSMTEKSIEARRADRKRRKAIQRGASNGIAVSPKAIFNRDGWKCQICTRPTPEKLRGTYKPNAPELDHIVPLSKGGPHTPSNIQTACRACNAEKSDKRVIGQMGLFTSLL
jgi:5-methylcytosine-specific restriction endonuclease McrA